MKAMPPDMHREVMHPLIRILLVVLAITFIIDGAAMVLGGVGVGWLALGLLLLALAAGLLTLARRSPENSS